MAMDRKKIVIRYVPVYHQGGGQYIVESLSRKGEYHAVDLLDKTCTCERFLLDPIDKGKPCRHLEDLGRMLKAGVLL